MVRDVIDKDEADTIQKTKSAQSAKHHAANAKWWYDETKKMQDAIAKAKENDEQKAKENEKGNGARALTTQARIIGPDGTKEFHGAGAIIATNLNGMRPRAQPAHGKKQHRWHQQRW